MIGNIIGEEIDKYVSDQIDFRQKIQGAGRKFIDGSLPRDAKVLSFLNTRNTWVKLASGVGIEDTDGIQRIKDIIKPEGYTTEQTVTNEEGETTTDIVNIADADLESLKNDELAKSYVLFNTTQKINTDTSSQKTYTKRSGAITNSKWSDSFNKTYGGMGFRDQGLQPVPGITDVSIECVNRGSIKKAVVKLKAYNKFQFGIIELLYLRLGYTMMLEYGWDRYIDNINDTTQEITISEVGNTVIEQIWFDNPDPNPNAILTNIEANREDYKGNYDGFFGKVYNFEWNLNPDMTYDITINLITVGSIITSLKAKPPSVYTKSDLQDLRIRLQAAETGTSIESVDKDVEKNGEDILPMVGNNEISIWLIQQKLDITPREKYIWSSKTNLNEGQTKIFWPNLIEEYSKAWHRKKRTSQYQDYSRNTLSKKEFKNLGAKYFVHLHWFLDVFFTKVNTYIVNNDTSAPIPQLEFLGEIDDLICNYVPNLIPLDPKICVFKPAFEDDVLSDVFGENSTYEKLFNSNLFDYVSTDGGVSYGKILNLYMNVDFLLDILDQNIDNNGDLSVFQYLKNLCDGINRSMAGITNLEPIIKNDKFVTIIEQNTPKGYETIRKTKTNKEESVDFELIGYNKDKSNFVKNFKFVTKITPDLGNIISIGAAAANSDTKSIEALPFSKWNKGLKNIYQEKLVATPKATKEEEEEINAEKIEKDFINNAKILDNNHYANKTITFKWKTDTFEVLNRRDFGKNIKTYWENGNLQAKVFAAVRRNIEFEEIKLAQRKQNTSNAYFHHLAKAFGGASQEGIVSKNKKVITISYDPIHKKDARFWEINNDFIKNGKSLFKQYISDKQKTDYINEEVVSNSVGFIPLNLQMTVEGLSGVKIYNKLNIDQRFLPANYPEALSFITMKVNHSITNNYWDTNYECFSIPKSTKTPTGKVTTTTTSIMLDNDPTPSTDKAGNKTPTETVAGNAPGRPFSVIKRNTNSGLLYETSPEVPLKTQVVLHHTAGGGDIASVIAGWRDRPEESCVSTQYIIGRDGKYEKLFEDKYWSQHLGTGAAQDNIEQKTIGIELISYGPLVKTRNKDEYKSVVGDHVKTADEWDGVSKSQKIQPDNSHTITTTAAYKGYSYWQSYTIDQLKTLKTILLQIFQDYPDSGINNIPAGKGSSMQKTLFYSTSRNAKELAASYSFDVGKFASYSYSEKNTFRQFLRNIFPQEIISDEIKEKIINDPGVYSHNSYRTDKSDVAPLPELIDTLAVVGWEAKNKTKSQGKTSGYKW